LTNKVTSFSDTKLRRRTGGSAISKTLHQIEPSLLSCLFLFVDCSLLACC
jgi:hypothetical protein